MKSRYFKREEFACSCGCGFDTVDTDTLKILEAVRTRFRSAVKITSAARCTAHNASVGGSPDSQHLRGRACDIQVDGVHPDVVADFNLSVNDSPREVGRYQTFTHVDTRVGRVRW